MHLPQLPLACGKAVRYNVRLIIKMAAQIIFFITAPVTTGLAQNTPNVVTELVFTEAAVVDSGTGQNFHVTAAWPQTLDIPGNKLAVIATPSLDPPLWDWVDMLDVIPSNGSASQNLPMMGDKGFYKLATLADTTDSGQPDIMDWIVSTNPVYHDSDGDGLTDADEEYLGTNPNNPYSIYDSDPNNPDYMDENGNPLTDGEIVKKGCEPNEERLDLTPPEWDGIVGLDLTLADTWLDDDGWALYINVPFADEPGTNAVKHPAGIVLANTDDVTVVAERTIYIEAGQNVKFHIERVEIGQVRWFDEFTVTIDAFIPGETNEMVMMRGQIPVRYPAPNWLESPLNPPLFAQVEYGPNDEPPDVSEFVWWFTVYHARTVTVDDDDDGVCVLIYTPVTMRCQITPDPSTAKVPMPPNERMWQYRARNFQGNWEGWVNMGAGATPTEYTYEWEQGGVYGIRLFFFGEDKISPIYRRKVDEPFATTDRRPDSRTELWWRAGQPQAVGVCDTKFQVAVRNAARSYLGSTMYADNNVVPPQYGLPSYPGKNIKTNLGTAKCNIFVAHMCMSIDLYSIPVLVRITLGGLINSPPKASEWKAGTYVLDWPSSPNLQPGCVISNGRHMGITDYDGDGINAGGMQIHKAYNFFILTTDTAYRMYKFKEFMF